MASSGWQGQKDIQTSVFPHMALNLYISSISHSGTTLTYSGYVRVVCTSGYISYNGATVSLTGGSSKSINLNLSGGQYSDTGTFSCTISNVSATTTSKTVTASLSAGGVASGSASWTLTFDSSSSSPSGGSITGVSTTYNSVTGTVKIDSYGTSSSTSRTLELLVLEQSYVAGLPHRYNAQTNGNLSYTTTVNNSSTCPSAGCITIKGAGAYYTGLYASNGNSAYRYAGGVVYTNPAPLQTLSYTQTQNSTNVTVGLTITGGSNSNNNSNTVTTYYRYSTNGGSSYSNWTSAGTGTAWTSKTASFNCNYGASVVVQAKQTYQSKDSEIKQVSFTATTGTAPSGGSVSITSSTWNTVTLSASISSYGKPDGISGRKLAIGVRKNTSNLNDKRENQVENVTSATTTVTNSSVAPGATPLELKGMLPVYAYVWAWNTVTSATAYNNNVHYLPPAPGQLSFTPPETGNSYAVTFTGVASNNVTDYTASELTRTVRYKIDNGAWTVVENATVAPLTDVTNFNITIAPQETATVEAWLTYRGKNSTVSTTTIYNGAAPVHLYGSVNGQAKEIVKLYGSVNGARKELTRLYASVEGVAKKIYDNGS